MLIINYCYSNDLSWAWQAYNPGPRGTREKDLLSIQTHNHLRIVATDLPVNEESSGGGSPK